MTGSFGAAALRLSGQAALLAGWAPDTFWAATPAELAAILAAFAPPVGGAMDRCTLDLMLAQERDRDG